MAGKYEFSIEFREAFYRYPEQNQTLEKRASMLRSPVAPNPFLNPDEWGIFIDSLKAGFDRMLADERNGTD